MARHVEAMLEFQRRGSEVFLETPDLLARGVVAAPQLLELDPGGLEAVLEHRDAGGQGEAARQRRAAGHEGAGRQQRRRHRQHEQHQREPAAGHHQTQPGGREPVQDRAADRQGKTETDRFGGGLQAA